MALQLVVLSCDLFTGERDLIEDREPARVGRGCLRCVPRWPQVHHEESVGGSGSRVDDEAVVMPDLVHGV